MDTFYVSTPIYYVNGSPHIGHAYTTVAADTLARYHRLLGHDVFFMTGTDEHGLKVQREAEKAGLTPQQLADQNSRKFKDLFDRFEISYDRYIRTTEAQHTRVVQSIYEAMKQNGDIYLDKYEGWYAAADEAFYDESEIEDGKSIETGAAVEWVEEESYFFRLSKYQEPLLAWYKSNPDCVRPDSRYNEVYSFVEGGLQDLSISRTTFNWGIPVPGDPKHVLYVWLDALTNYITGAGAYGEDDEQWNKFWPCNLHILGKDILRFHAVYWPAFLLSAGLPLPRQLFIHGWWLVEGEKMSKRAGNWIDPHELADEYSLDLLRYYMLREIPFGNDGNFARDRLLARNNAELADNFGNLVNRTTRMVENFVEGVIKRGQSAEDDALLQTKAEQTFEEVQRAMDAREFHRALEAIFAFSSELNLYLHNNQPWKLRKDEAQHDRMNHVLYQTIEGIRWVATLLLPFTPDAANKVLDALDISGADVPRTFASLQWGQLPDGHTITSPPVLFEKLELEKKEEVAPQEQTKQKKTEEKKKSAAKDEKAGGEHISFNDFQAVEMRVGKVLEASNVEGSEKLLLLKVDVGEEQPRQVVAGIAKAYSPEDLIGNHYAVVTNLKPAKIFKIRSEAMMLAADTTDGKLSLANFPPTVAPGTRIG